MYIRRKVFSLLTDSEGNERYFSTTEFNYDAEEKTFAECEGEDCSEGEKKKSHLGAKIAGGVAGTTAAVGGGIYGANKYGQHMVKKAKEQGGRLLALKDTGILNKSEQAAADKLAKNIVRGEKLQKPAQTIAKHAGKLKKIIKK